MLLGSAFCYGLYRQIPFEAGPLELGSTETLNTFRAKASRFPHPVRTLSEQVAISESSPSMAIFSLIMAFV